jgi:hypothetical protein
MALRQSITESIQKHTSQDAELGETNLLCFSSGVEWGDIEEVHALLERILHCLEGCSFIRSLQNPLTLLELIVIYSLP